MTFASRQPHQHSVSRTALGSVGLAVALGLALACSGASGPGPAAGRPRTTDLVAKSTDAGGFNRPVLRPFAGSQAESLKIGYGIRSGNPVPDDRWQRVAGLNWVDQVVINGTERKIDQCASDPQLPYTIHDAGLAARVGAELGIPFVAGDALSAYELTCVVSQALKNDLMNNAVGMGGGDTVVPGDPGSHRLFPRLFDQLPVSAQEKAYRDYLLTQVASRARAAGRADFAADPAAYAYVAPDAAAWPLATAMRNLLQAIEGEDENRFLDNLAIFWDAWGSRQAGAKNAFLESMALLFVTRSFSSVATTSFYFHAILRCGQIHT